MIEQPREQTNNISAIAIRRPVFTVMPPIGKIEEFTAKTVLPSAAMARLDFRGDMAFFDRAFCTRPHFDRHLRRIWFHH